MGDLCLWRNVVFFVATSRNHFSDIVVLVERRSIGSEIQAVPKNPLDDNNYSSIVVIALLLVLFGLEQGLLYVRTRTAQSTHGPLEKRQDCKTYKQEEGHKDKGQELVVEEVATKKCDEQIEYLSTTDIDASFLTVLDDIRVGIANYPPQRAEDGTSGVYFMKNTTGRSSAVFKPADEEAINLEGHNGGEIKPGCMAGEGYLKEVAASLLDKDGFHGVPPTILAKCMHNTFNNSGVPSKKAGSLQQFVSSKCTAEDMGWSKFSARDVHKIGLLDCRVLNLDRHLGNILVTEDDNGAYHLVPIDHALSMPSTISGGGAFEWLSFPQCKQPFDEETVNFVCNIDVDSDVQRIRRELPNMREECVEVMKICTLFMKRGVEKGFNLFEIGCMMSRYMNEEEACELEKMYIRIRERMVGGGGNLPFWSVVDEEIEESFKCARS